MVSIVPKISGDNSDTDDVHSFIWFRTLIIGNSICLSDYQIIWVFSLLPTLKASDFALIGILSQAVSDIAARRHFLQQSNPAHLGLQQLQQDLMQFFSSQVGNF